MSLEDLQGPEFVKEVSLTVGCAVDAISLEFAAEAVANGEKDGFPNGFGVRPCRFTTFRLPVLSSWKGKGSCSSRFGLATDAGASSLRKPSIFGSNVKDQRDQRAREIQERIDEALMKYWDPIGVADVPEARGEYSSYVGPVYRILAGSRSEEELISYLFHMETKNMGLQTPSRDHLRAVARQLLDLEVSL